MLIGYARLLSGTTSKEKQRRDALEKLAAAYCEKIFFETALPSERREMLTQLIAELTHDDVLIVPALEHLGRTHKELFDTLTLLQARGAQFGIAGKLLAMTEHDKELSAAWVQVFTKAFSEIASEQTKRGKRAGADRDKGGRPRKMTEARALEVLALLKGGKDSQEIASRLRLRIQDVEAEIGKIPFIGLDDAIRVFEEEQEAARRAENKVAFDEQIEAVAAKGKRERVALIEKAVELLQNPSGNEDADFNQLRELLSRHTKRSTLDPTSISEEERLLRLIFRDPRLRSSQSEEKRAEQFARFRALTDEMKKKRPDGKGSGQQGRERFWEVLAAFEAKISAQDRREARDRTSSAVRSRRLERAKK